jgi:hypothetical protein
MRLGATGRCLHIGQRADERSRDIFPGLNDRLRAAGSPLKAVAAAVGPGFRVGP